MTSKLISGGAIAAALLVGSCFSQSARAEVLNLFNTGVDASGIALAGPDGTTDSHYSVVSSTGGVGNGPAVTYFNGAYAANSAASSWISNSSTGGPGSQTITFETTFNVTGVASETITGLWGADNGGTILLNNVSTGNFLDATGNPTSNFNVLHGFSFTADAGLNTLEFQIVDTGEPLAFRFEVDSPVTISAVPEPSTWAMLILGFAGIGIISYRRKPKLNFRFA